MTIAFSNPSPAAPTGVSAIGGTKQITVKWTYSTDYDYAYTIVQYATTVGGTYTTGAKITGDTCEISGLAQATTYWVKCAHVDSFGESSLNYSTPVSTATDNFNSLVDARIGTAVINGSQLVGNSVPQAALSTEALYAPLAVIGDVRNLVRNSLGDRGTDGWTGSYITTSVGEPWATYSGNQYKGGAALVFDNRDATYGDFIPVQPGDQFWVSMANIPRGGGTANYPITIGIATYNKDKVAIAWSGVTRATDVWGYQLLQGTCSVSSSDAVYVKPWVSIAKTANTFTGGTVGDGFLASAITVTRKNKGELIVDGSIYGNQVAANTITATNIDSRGLSIKDASGNVILASGTALAGTYINQGKPGNLLQNTENSSNEAFSGKGWGNSTNTSLINTEMTYTTGLTLWPSGSAWFPIGSNPFVQQQIGASGDSATNYAQTVSDHIPIIPGQRYEASVYVQSHRCALTMYLVFFAEDGVTQVAAPNSNTGGAAVELTDSGTARDLSQWRRLALFYTAPTTARTCKLYMRKYVTFETETVNLTSYAWWLYPYVGAAGANQTTFSDYSPGAEWVPSGTIRTGNQITAANVSTYIASAAIAEAYIGTITSAKIDTRNLTIKDAAGNVIFGSGQNVDWSRVTASSGWLNSNIGVSGGALTGIGTGAGTVVANSSIAIDGGGNLTGIGSGSGNTVANFAIGINSSGLITGIGTGVNTQVSNAVIGQYGNLLTNTENKSNENPLGKGWSIVSTASGLDATTISGTEQARQPSNPWEWQPVGANATFILQTGTAAASPTDYSDWVSDQIPALGNCQYEYSCYLQTHRCKTELWLVYYNQTNDYIGSSYGGACEISLGSSTTSRNIAAWTRLGNIGTTPASCVSIRMFIRKYRTYSGMTDSYSFHLNPYVGRAGANQTALSPYSPGAEWVPNGTVRPYNPITLANISTYIASAAIGTAYIGDLAVTNAKMANLSVTTGKIADLAVNTLQIANQAVTVPASVTVPTWAGSGDTVVNNSYTDTLWGTVYESNDILLCSVTMTTSGAPVTLLTTCGRMPAHTWNGYTSGSSRLRLFRDGTLIAEGHHGAWGVHGIDRVLNWRDTPSAGSHTYTLYFRYGLSTPNTMPFGSNTWGYCNNSSIIALETKK